MPTHFFLLFMFNRYDDIQTRQTTLYNSGSGISNNISPYQQSPGIIEPLPHRRSPPPPPSRSLISDFNNSSSGEFMHF